MVLGRELRSWGTKNPFNRELRSYPGVFKHINKKKDIRRMPWCTYGMERLWKFYPEKSILSRKVIQILSRKCTWLSVGCANINFQIDEFIYQDVSRLRGFRPSSLTSNVTACWNSWPPRRRPAAAPVAAALCRSRGRRRPCGACVSDRWGMGWCWSMYPPASHLRERKIIFKRSLGWDMFGYRGSNSIVDNQF